MTTMTFTTTTRPAFSGCYTALITPFRNGELDLPALRTLVERQILGGVAGLVPCGTTGETPALTTREWETVVTTVVETTQGRVPVIAGTGSNGTASTIERTQRAQKLGADAALVVTPYYNKPTQDGLYQHFAAIANATEIPLVLYNVPGRTVADMHNDTVLRLAQVDGIIGLKEASGDIERAAWLIKQLPQAFSLYSGDDATAVALMLLGGRGNVSVTANLAPRAMHELCMAAIEGQVRRAAEIHLRLLPLHRYLFCEPSPAPTKWAMAQLGLCGAAARLPIVPLTAAGEAKVAQALRDSGLR